MALHVLSAKEVSQMGHIFFQTLSAAGQIEKCFDSLLGVNFMAVKMGGR